LTYDGSRAASPLLSDSKLETGGWPACVYILGKSPSYKALFLWLALEDSAIGQSD